MKSLFFITLTFLCLCTYAQRKNSTISVSHYPNAELYLKANVVCRITDKSGKPATSGNYLSIENKSGNNFSYSYPAAGSMRIIPPGKKILIPVKRDSPYSFVPLKVVYTPATQSRPYEKMRELRTIHSESDRLIFKDAPARIPSKPKAIEKTVAKSNSKSAPKANSLPKPQAAKVPLKITIKAAPVDQPADSMRCIDTNLPAYYTFYYLKVNDEVIYSNIFAVPQYTLEEEGLNLLEQAWMCFVPALRVHYSEERMDEVLIDQDNDLQLGLLHLRDPFIPSDTIAKRYPYTNSFEAAQAEQDRWIAADKEKYPGLRFIKVIF